MTKRFTDIFAPRSLRMQLLSRSLLVLSGLLLLIGVFQYVVMESFMYRNYAQSIQSQLMSLPPSMWGQRTDTQDRDRDRDTDRDADRSNQQRFLVTGLSLAVIQSDGTYKLISSMPDGSSTPQLSVEEYRGMMNSNSNLNYRITKDSEGNQQLTVFQVEKEYKLHSASFQQLLV